MQHKIYGIKYAGRQYVSPASSLAEAQFRRRKGDMVMISDVTHDEYVTFSPWREAHCEYGGVETCSKDLAEIAGHIVCFYCWAEAFEHLQAEIRYQQMHGQRAA